MISTFSRSILRRFLEWARPVLLNVKSPQFIKFIWHSAALVFDPQITARRTYGPGELRSAFRFKRALSNRIPARGDGHRSLPIWFGEAGELRHCGCAPSMTCATSSHARMSCSMSCIRVQCRASGSGGCFGARLFRIPTDSISGPLLPWLLPGLLPNVPATLMNDTGPQVKGWCIAVSR
jgi:hypothetical protein